MNVDEIREHCLAFAGSTEKLQWGDALCFKISGKMFAVLGLDNPRLSFKCSPESFAELIERENIGPSPYLGRHKWVLLERLDAVGSQELRELIRKSYQMIKAKAPQKARKQGVSGARTRAPAKTQRARGHTKKG